MTEATEATQSHQLTLLEAYTILVSTDGRLDNSTLFMFLNPIEAKLQATTNEAELLEPAIPLPDPTDLPSAFRHYAIAEQLAKYHLDYLIEHHQSDPTLLERFVTTNPYLLPKDYYQNFLRYATGSLAATHAPLAQSLFTQLSPNDQSKTAITLYSHLANEAKSQFLTSLIKTLKQADEGHLFFLASSLAKNGHLEEALSVVGQMRSAQDKLVSYTGIAYDLIDNQHPTRAATFIEQIRALLLDPKTKMEKNVRDLAPQLAIVFHSEEDPQTIRQFFQKIHAKYLSGDPSVIQTLSDEQIAELKKISPRHSQGTAADIIIASFHPPSGQTINDIRWAFTRADVHPSLYPLFSLPHNTAYNHQIFQLLISKNNNDAARIARTAGYESIAGFLAQNTSITLKAPSPQTEATESDA